jgi:hypothetical protein
MRRLLLAIFLPLNAACSFAVNQAAQKAQRRPLMKEAREYRTLIKYERRVIGYDPRTGEEITYDHKPRIEPLGDGSDRWTLKWIGFDGREKTVIFQGAGALDVIVSASVAKMPDGQYLYTYEVMNLPTSRTHLKRFIVQNFASEYPLVWTNIP